MLDPDGGHPHCAPKKGTIAGFSTQGKVPLMTPRLAPNPAPNPEIAPCHCPE